jgi:hypothetical protein
MVAAYDARQSRTPHRLGHRRGEHAAQPAHRDFLAALRRRRMQNRAERHASAAMCERLGNLRDERFGGVRTARIGAAKAPRCSDQLNVSLHRYIQFRERRRGPLERRRCGWCPIVTQ